MTLDDDVVEAAERLQAEQGIDLDDALNLLARRGMLRSKALPSGPGSVVHPLLSVADDEAPFHPRG